MVGFQYFYAKPHADLARQQAVTAETPGTAVHASPVALSDLRDRAEILKESTRVAITTPELHGSVNLKGGRLDDLDLVNYRETSAADSPHITLLSPSGSALPHLAYYAEFGWLAGKNVKDALPDGDTAWKADGTSLTPQHPLHLTWDNGQGGKFERVIAVDDQAMFTVTDRVTNKGNAPLTLYPYGLVVRQGNPVLKSSAVLHEGPLGVLGGTLDEISYKDLIEARQKTEPSTGGWLGITDKYWLVAMIPPHDETITAKFAYDPAGQSTPDMGRFQADFLGAPATVEPNMTAEHVTHLFAGAKRVRLLDQYADRYDITRFDRAIDFGRFYFLTKPFLYFLAWLDAILGGVGPAILVFTVLLKLATLPLSLKSYHSMSRMKALQPEMKRIQERFADDKMRQSQETMELYKREKVSPLSGCLPTLIQIPIFFALYKVLYVNIEMRQAPFYGWIKDMSAPDPTSVFNLFGLVPVDLPQALHIGVWPLLMGLSMFLQQRLSPQPPDKSQARMFMLMPILFTYMLAQMPAGLVIYWTWSNLLGIAQQWFIMGRDARKGGERKKA
jgi:YidC/Oxa1 family membrane protein insertase